MKKATAKAHHAKGATHAKAAAKPPSAAELQKEIKSLQSEVEHIKHPATAKSKHKATTGTKHKATVKHGSKKRTLTPGDVSCCTAEALAMSLRLQGVPVADEDVLALYWHTADNPDAGASVLETLEAAWRYGLGGVRPWFRPLEDAADLLDHGERHLGLSAHEPDRQSGARLAEVGLGHLPGPLEQLGLTGDEVTCLASVDLGEQPPRDIGAGGELPVERGLVHGASLILGVELPGPHTLLAADGGLWSWGEPFDPAEWPDAVVEEAWAVSWS